MHPFVSGGIRRKSVHLRVGCFKQAALIKAHLWNKLAPCLEQVSLLFNTGGRDAAAAAARQWYASKVPRGLHEPAARYVLALDAGVT